MYENAALKMDAAKRLQRKMNELARSPAEGSKPATDLVIDAALVRGAPGNFVRVVDQINGTYERGWYDACAVMLRRLLEMLIIESFVANGMKDKIKSHNGRFLRLAGLIRMVCDEPSWELDNNFAVLRELSAIKLRNWKLVCAPTTQRNLPSPIATIFWISDKHMPAVLHDAPCRAGVDFGEDLAKLK